MGETSDKLKEHMGELRTTLDELRVKLHLAGMDLKSGWEALVPATFDKIENKLSSLGGKAANELSTSLSKAAASLDRLAKEIAKKAE